MRKRLVVIAALAASTVAGAAAHAGQVEVSFVKPDQFSDAGRGAIDRERTMSSLGDYLKSLGAELPQGQTLKLAITDIDLAGELRWRSGNDIRVLRNGADWPRIALNWQLLDGTRTVRQGEAKVSDMSYLFTMRGYDLQQADLPYEKRMLKQWFEQNFVSK